MKNNIPILLVEDDDVDIETVKRAFKKNKFTNPLYIAHNGEEAIQFLRNEGEYSDLQKCPRPSIILLDLNMPVMNGIEFLKIIKNDDKNKTIPVIVLTTSKEENDRIDSYELSVAGYIIKPVEFAKFVEAIKTIRLYWSLCELL
ncbi:MAG: response regulator [Calditrichia bacterium]|nr:response regulator [Calditrichia bacterium]